MFIILAKCMILNDIMTIKIVKYKLPPGLHVFDANTLRFLVVCTISMSGLYRLSFPGSRIHVQDTPTNQSATSLVTSVYCLGSG